LKVQGIRRQKAEPHRGAEKSGLRLAKTLLLNLGGKVFLSLISTARADVQGVVGAFTATGGVTHQMDLDLVGSVGARAALITVAAC
jgi:hypothetical protein